MLKHKIVKKTRLAAVYISDMNGSKELPGVCPDMDGKEVRL